MWSEFTSVASSLEKRACVFLSRQYSFCSGSLKCEVVVESQSNASVFAIQLR